MCSGSAVPHNIQSWRYGVRVLAHSTASGADEGGGRQDEERKRKKTKRRRKKKRKKKTGTFVKI